MSFVPSLNAAPHFSHNEMIQSQNSELKANRHFLKQLLIKCLQKNIYFNLKIIWYSLKNLIVYFCMQK